MEYINFGIAVLARAPSLLVFLKGSMQLEEGKEESAWNSPQPSQRDWVPAQNKLSGPLGGPAWDWGEPLIVTVTAAHWQQNGRKQLQASISLSKWLSKNVQMDFQ